MPYDKTIFNLNNSDIHVLLLLLVDLDCISLQVVQVIFTVHLFIVLVVIINFSLAPIKKLVLKLLISTYMYTILSVQIVYQNVQGQCKKTQESIELAAWLIFLQTCCQGISWHSLPTQQSTAQQNRCIFSNKIWNSGIFISLHALICVRLIALLNCVRKLFARKQ